MTADAESANPEPAPLVSVIIPTWNRAPMLRLTLATVLAQDLTDFEALVIGDGCTDDSAEVAAGFNDGRLHWQNLPVNSGAPSIPNNTGLRQARGRYIAHLGHDDFWLPWHLSGLVFRIEESGADWVYSLVVAVGPDDIRHCTGPPRSDVPDAEHHVPPSGWLYRREVVADVGWWANPETLEWQIDFDYMRRAALAGKRFAFHDRPTAIKFPSSLFPDGYRTGDPAPIQRAYFDRIARDPAGLEHEMLRRLATRFAQLDRGGDTGIFAREPAPRVSLRSFQERRKDRLVLRGLAEAPKANDARPPRSRATDGVQRAERPRRQSSVSGAAAMRWQQRENRRERRQQRANRGNPPAAGQSTTSAAGPESIGDRSSAPRHRSRKGDQVVPLAEPIRSSPPSTAPVADPTPAPRPEHRSHEGRFVRVEPLDPVAHSQELFATSHGDETKARIWDYLAYGPFSSDEEFTAHVERQAASTDPLFFAIRPHASGRAEGIASLMNIVPANRSIEIGHIWLGPSLQRSPAATEALYLLIAHALDDLGYRRMEWKCNAANAASRAAACRLGFIHEGVFHQHMIVKGANRDTAWFSILDREWPAIRANFATWLDPSNFDAEGLQRQSLGGLNRVLASSRTT